MNTKELFLARRELRRVAGRLEYNFFTAMLISVALLSAVLVMAVNAFFKTDYVKSAYTQLFSKSVSSVAQLNFGPLPEFADNLLKALNELIYAVFENAPTVACFLLVCVFLLCPVYQGTVRYCAYLIEEGRALPLTAVLFYFTSPALYFFSALLTVSIVIRKSLITGAFLLPSALFFFAGSVFDSTYLDQRAIGGGIKLLSLVLFAFSLVLCAIFLNKYSAVRYLFALGSRKKLFKASAQLTKKRRTWLFKARLGLMLNLLPAVFVVTAPMCLARVLSGEGLLIKWLIKNKKQVAAEAT